MPYYREKAYESEHTRFIRELLKQKPHLVEEQAKGRAIWWDKTLDRDERKRFEDARVPQQPYVYQNKV